MKKCPNGHEVSDNVKFCPQCGAEVMESSNMVCKKCGNEQKEGERFCSKCGTPFENITTTSKPKKSKIAIIASVVVLAIVVVAIGGYLCFFNGDKYGKYSLEGLAKITCQYDRIDSFHDGVAAVYKGDKVGFIDRMGNEIISPSIETETEYIEFSDGLAAFLKDGKYGFVNKKGETVIPCKYDMVEKFEEGYCCVAIDMKYGVINKEGVEIIPLKYNSVRYANEGLFEVSDKNYNYGYVDLKGEEVVPCKYGSVSDFHEGLAFVSFNDKFGYINNKGKVIVDFKYEGAQDFANGYATVKKNGKWGYVDKEGKEIIPFEYDSVLPFNEGLAAVAKSDKFGFIDKNNEIIVPFQYDDVDSFSEGVAFVSSNYKYGYINNKGETVIPLKYEQYMEGYKPSFYQGVALAYKNEKYGMINKKGEEIVPFIYDEAFDFSEGLAAVCKDGIWGYVDTNGKSTFDVMSEETKAQIKEKQRIEQEKREEEERKREEENKPMNRFFNIAQTEDFAWKCFEYQSFDFRLDNTDEVLLYFKPVNNGGGSAFYVSHKRGENNSWYTGLSGFGQYTVSENFMTMTISSMYRSSSGPRWDDKHLKFLIENDGEKVRLIRIFNPPHRVMDADYNYMNIDKADYIQISKPMDNPFNRYHHL